MIALLGRFAGVARERIVYGFKAIYMHHDATRCPFTDAMGGFYVGLCGALYALAEILR